MRHAQSALLTGSHGGSAGCEVGSRTKTRDISAPVRRSLCITNNRSVVFPNISWIPPSPSMHDDDRSYDPDDGLRRQCACSGETYDGVVTRLCSNTPCRHRKHFVPTEYPVASLLCPTRNSFRCFPYGAGGHRVHALPEIKAIAPDVLMSADTGTTSFSSAISVGTTQANDSVCVFLLSANRRSEPF